MNGWITDDDNKIDWFGISEPVKFKMEPMCLRRSPPAADQRLDEDALSSNQSGKHQEQEVVMLTNRSVAFCFYLVLQGKTWVGQKTKGWDERTTCNLMVCLYKPSHSGSSSSLGSHFVSLLVSLLSHRDSNPPPSLLLSLWTSPLC